MTDNDFNTLCDALDVLSDGAGLFYVLSHPYEYDELTIRLAEYVDTLDAERTY